MCHAACGITVRLGHAGWWNVQAIEAGITAGRSDSSAMQAAGFEEPGLYRLRPAADPAVSAAFIDEMPATVGELAAGLLGHSSRLVLPVLVLIGALLAICLNLHSKLPVLTGERWLTVGHALVPATFFVVALTNRRYGPAYAFVQVVLSCFAVLLVALLASGEIRTMLPAHTELGLRLAGAFGVSFFVASFVSIVMFDAARGPRWWLAPLLGLLSGSFVFCALFYPTAHGGTQTAWIHQMVVHLGLAFGGSVVLLLPYWLLRGVVRPLSGYGGY
jgi:uncharacterized PurR-regulated membrane protein YhhQ (DUF165 family)